MEIIELHEPSGTFRKLGEFDHPYPTSKLMFSPGKGDRKDDLLATTGDYLRLWNINENGQIKCAALLKDVTSHMLYSR